MKTRQRSLIFGNRDPAWVDFLESVGHDVEGYFTQRDTTRLAATTAIQRMKAANQQRLRQERLSGGSAARQLAGRRLREIN